MKIEILVLTICWFEFSDNLLVRDRQPQRSRLFIGCRRIPRSSDSRPSNENRGCRHSRSSNSRNTNMACGPFLRREGIAPAEAVPIIDVKRDRHEIFPKPSSISILPEAAFRRWTTAAALRSKKLDQVDFLRGRSRKPGRRFARSTHQSARSNREEAGS